MKILIIDDERAARESLSEKLLQISPSLKITKANGALEGLQNLKEKTFDVVFLDIQMPGLTGFELLGNINPEDRHFSLVFCTAYSEYSLKAFEEEAIDYLLKPVEKERLQKTLERLQKSNLAKWNDFVEDHQKENALTKFTVKTGDQIKILQSHDILFFTSDHHETLLIGKDGSEYIVELSLDRLEEQLDHKQFFRTHRSFIVNIDAIANVDSHKMIIHFKDCSLTARVSKRKKTSFLSYLRT